MEHLRSLIRDVPDFPKEGILFKDITPLLKDAQALRQVLTWMAEPLYDEGIDLVAGIEARGFILAAGLAVSLGAGFVPIRKPGKLPAERLARSYDLEYGSNTLEVHRDAIQPGQRVVLLDDLLATGGTARAALELITERGGEVAQVLFMIELADLGGRAQFDGYEVRSLLRY